MGRVAVSGFLDLVWSEESVAEARASLISRKGLSAEIADSWVGHLVREFPAGRIDIAALPHEIDLSAFTRDAGDQHICALALAGGAQFVFSHDRGYLGEPLAAHGIAVMRPDVFLTDLLQDNAQILSSIIDGQAAAWGGNRFDDPVKELLDALERAGAPTFAATMRLLA